MAYIGKQPVVGNFQKCDAISVVNGQAAYTLNVGGSAVTPENANHMLVSLNGVLQAPGDSFTVSGSTLTFASNLATGDVIDFVVILGDVLDLGTPSDNSITTAKLASDAVTEAKIADDAVESEHLNNNSDTARNRENSAGNYFQILDEVREVVAEPGHFVLNFYSPSDSNAHTYADWIGTYSRDEGQTVKITGAAQHNQAQAQDGIRFYMSSGNIDSGVFKLYGLT